MIPIQMMVAAGAVVLAGAAVVVYGAGRFKAGAESVRLEYAKAAEVAAENSRLLGLERSRINGEIDREYTVQQGKSAAAADRDRALSERLRQQVAAVDGASSSDASGGGCADTDRSRTLAGLLTESIGLVAEGAERTRQLADTVEGLRRYASEVCLKAPE